MYKPNIVTFKRCDYLNYNSLAASVIIKHKSNPKQKMKKIILFTLVICSFGIYSKAQVDTINAANNKLKIENLKEGKSTYLVYFTDTLDKKRTVGDLWERSTKFTKVNGADVVAFDWKWIHADTVLANILNICDHKTLAPIYHKADYKKRGIFAYDYRDGFMVPSDTINNNEAVKKGKVKLDIPIISWELDLETYPLLPIKKIGQKFDVSFFDPNEKVATYHRYEVIGKEDLVLNSDTKVKCWLLKIDYNKESYATFWLTEKSKEVIKMKEYFKGNYRIKVKQY